MTLFNALIGVHVFLTILMLIGSTCCGCEISVCSLEKSETENKGTIKKRVGRKERGVSEREKILSIFKLLI